MSGNPPTSVTSLSLEDAVVLLCKSGAKEMDLEKLNSDIESGAPVNSGGTINILHYTAWLVREVVRGSD